MKRLLLCLALACPFCVAGFVAVGVVAWGLVALGLVGLVTPVLVVGLAAAVPLSIVAADRCVPGRLKCAQAVARCPTCGHVLVDDAALNPTLFWNV